MRIQSARDLGALVRTQRKRKGWTQIHLAEQVGVRALWISQFERGKTTAQIGLVLRTLRALDLSLSVDDARAPAIDLDSLVSSLPDELIVEEDRLAGKPLPPSSENKGRARNE